VGQRPTGASERIWFEVRERLAGTVGAQLGPAFFLGWGAFRFSGSRGGPPPQAAQWERNYNHFLIFFFRNQRMFSLTRKTGFNPEKILVRLPETRDPLKGHGFFGKGRGPDRSIAELPENCSRLGVSFPWYGKGPFPVSMGFIHRARGNAP